MSLDKLVGQTLDDKYKIERELGKGGMGAVYLATHLGTERAVAIKVISPQFMRRPEFVERFKREAKAAGRLRHPNVVDVTDFGFSESVIGNVAYLVMEFLDGCTLGEILEEEKQLPLKWSLDILEQVASAVHEAHTQGIIHRDLKPDNIWLEPNQRGGYTVKVLDFGIAKLEQQQEETEKNGFDTQSKLSGAVTVADTTADKSTLAINQTSAGKETSIENFSHTVGDMRRNETVFSDFNNNQTLINEADEKGTLAFTENSSAQTEVGTMIVEADNQTLIQGDFTDIEDENGTQILLAPKETVKNTVNITDDDDEDSGDTKIMTEQSDEFVASNGKKTSENRLVKSPVENLVSETDNSSLTRAGAVLGTPLYMSPEQCRGEKLDARADIYALGVIAYQMLAGNTPFSGTYTEVMKAHCETPPPPLKAKKVPQAVKKTIALAMAKKAEERPPSAMTFASRLRADAESTGSLLQRSLVIWGEHLPTFLRVTFVLTLPATVLTLIYAVVQFLIVSRVISSVVFETVFEIAFSSAILFFCILFHSIAIGIATWIVIQLLSVPLRPVSWRPAFAVAKKNWKKWAVTVSLSSFISFLGFIFGIILGIALYIWWIYRDGRKYLSMIFKPNEPHNQTRWQEFRENLTGREVLKNITFFFVVFSGFYWSIRYSLVSPILMMEGIAGRKAMRRSAELVKRSYWTALTVILIYILLPLTLSGLTAMITNSMVKEDDKSKPIVKTEKIKEKESGELSIRVNGEPIMTESATADGETEKSETENAKPDRNLPEETEKRTARRLLETLKETIFQLIWLPISIVLTSFSAVTLALLYLKTRQAGGESMKELLGKFEEERPQMKWQLRAKERLEQKGRLASKGS